MMITFLRFISLLILIAETIASLSRFSHQKCGLYGMPPCNTVPAPSGVTPICATPGKTYCESVPQYPAQAIRYLLQKWGTDNVNDLIVDETIDNFEMIRVNGVPFFNNNNLPTRPTAQTTQTSNPPPTDSSGFDHFNSGYNYPNPNNNFTDTMPPSPTPKYGNKVYMPTDGWTIHHNNINNNNNNRNDDAIDRYWQASGDVLQQPPLAVSAFSYSINQRYVRDLSSQKKKIIEVRPSNGSASPTSMATKSRSSSQRVKRQNSGREELCQTNYQYITPQAALNSQGNWMFIVNQVDLTRQLVRTETCASTVCSNICSLPNGYSSRCEQKYVQKRLIALNAEGTNLYTDTFWFPSCCACTIAPPTM